MRTIEWIGQPMRSLPFGVGLALAALISAVVLGIVSTRADLKTLQAASQDNLFWPHVQIERDFNALQVTIAQKMMKPETGTEDIKNGFKALKANTVNIHLSGLVDEEYESKILTLLFDIQPLIENLSDSSTEQLLEASKTLQGFETKLHNATAQARINDQRRVAVIRDSIRQSLMLTTAALVLSLIVALVLTFLSTRQAKKNVKLIDDAKSAASSRKKFFEMMSHEVRTPLNGVLGSLALLREETDQKTRTSLIDEAQASAHRLSNLVSDAVDLNADEKLEIKPTLFRLESFIAAIDATLAPQIKRHKADLQFSGLLRSDFLLKCDDARLTNALSYIIGNALQRGGAKFVHLTISLNEELLSVEIETDVILPHDAFGETLARGILERLGGKVIPWETKRIITIPVEIIKLSAKLSFNSKALRHMYEALLKANGITVVDETNPSVNLILAEVSQDPTTFLKLSNEHPEAALIACGIGPNSDLVDEVATTPDDIMRAVYSALTKHLRNMEIAA